MATRDCEGKFTSPVTARVYPSVNGGVELYIDAYDRPTKLSSIAIEPMPVGFSYDSPFLVFIETEALDGYGEETYSFPLTKEQLAKYIKDLRALL